VQTFTIIPRSGLNTVHEVDRVEVTVLTEMVVIVSVTSREENSSAGLKINDNVRYNVCNSKGRG
jgi:hypothetical protein